MTFTSATRDRIWMLAGGLMAVVLGVEIAEGSLLLPGLFAGAFIAIALAQAQPLRIPAILIGFALVGYIVGNRGFAQISITPSLPILPAEFVLFAAGVILLFRSAVNRTTPVEKDALNVSLLIWILLSSLRFVMDIRTFGVMALRDFATIYYATFFFIAQDAGARAVERSFMSRCILWGLGLLVIIVPIYQLFPDFFLNRLTFRGTPLIFFKGDLEGTFEAAGSVLFYARYEKLRSNWSLVLSLALAALTIESNNRASMLGLILAASLLLLGGRRGFAITLSLAACAAMLLFMGLAFARNKSWHETPVYDAYERVESLVDPNGLGNYTGEETFNKGDNNAFRSLWWKISIDQALGTNPWMGLGWGYDLAETFERIYYPEGNDEFTARSPHDIFVTIFARSGIVGIVPFLAVVGAIGMSTLRAIKRRRTSAYLWAASCVILTSSAFGVVLEGPMGAVVFWSMLGLASSYDLHEVPSAMPEKTA
jgi:hypothetical protein